MGTIRPRPQTSPTLAGQNAARDKNTEQIRRLLSQPRKAPAAVAGGAMQGFTRATPSEMFWGSSVQARGWSFDSTVDQSPAAKPSLILDDSTAYFGPTVAGWYTTHAQMQFTLGSGSPAGVLIQANNNSADVSAFGEVWAQNIWDGRFRASFWCGPFWCDGSSTPLGLRALVPGAWTPGALGTATFVDVWRVG